MSGQSQIGSAGGWMLNALKQNPEGALLLAAGAVLMMRKASATRPLPQALSQDPHQSAGNGFSAGIQDSVAKVAEQAKQTASSYASAASDYAATVGRSVGEQSSHFAEQAQSALQSTVNRVIQDQPLAIALVGLAAGAAVAAAFPATEMEKQALGPIGERLSDTAERLGGQLKKATTNAGEKLKSAADERGLNVDGLKEVAGEVATAFSNTMTGKSESDPDSRKPGEFQPPNQAADTKHH